MRSPPKQPNSNILVLSPLLSLTCSPCCPLLDKNVTTSSQLRNLENMIYTFPLHPTHTLTVLLYTNITNASTIIPTLQSHSLPAAVLQTTHIASMFTLLSAANRALHNAHHKQLKTHAVESELLYNLSPSHSISHAFRTFGVADDSTTVVVCMFDATPETLAILDSAIQGEKVDNPQPTVDAMPADKVARLTKMYKIKPVELVRRTLPDAIDTLLSVRNFKSR